MATDAASSRAFSATAERPYAPAWINRLTWWIDHAPGRPWLVFAAFLAFTESMTLVAGQIASVTANGGIVAGLYYGALPVALLWLIYYLDGEAHDAMDDFEPALEVSESDAARLRYQLTVIPAAPALIVTVLALLGQATQYILDPAGSLIVGLSPVGLALRAVGEGLVTILIVMLLYHTIRQLRAVDRLHTVATRIDLFRPAPLYAFSLLTSRTGIGLILIIATSLVADPTTYQAMSLVLLVTWVGGMMVVAIAAFVLPLRGMHRRIAAEKSRLQGEAGERLKATIAALHRSVDNDDLAQADGLNKTLASLVSERDVLERLPTWPWRSGTLGAFVTALGLPIVLFLITRYLDRLV